jgi:hypothetical protein
VARETFHLACGWCVVAGMQTLRRILHLRGPSIHGEHGVELKLRVLPLDFAALDVAVPGQAVQLPDHKNEAIYQAEVSGDWR